MSTLALPQPRALRWNWPRVGALSGTLSLHVVAIALLLVPPVAMQVTSRAREEVVPVRLIREPPKFEEPPAPVPPRIVHEVRQRPPVPPVVTAPPPAPVESPLPGPAATPPARARDAPAAFAADTAPVALAYLTRTRVPYPKDALQRREQGTVILRVLVGADGVPQTIEIEKSSGSRSLDLAARAAVAHWTFTPGTLNGERTALWARVPIAFSLSLL